jgi:siroheme synthase-like protein
MSTENVLEPPFLFFPVSLNLRGRRCVVIGNDREAIEKDAALREAGADVLWIKDESLVRDDDVAHAFFVIATPQDEMLAARLRALADRHRFLLCAIDQPKYGFVAMQAIVKSGPARVAISTGGVSPRVGGVLRAALQDALDDTFARFIECLGVQRQRNRVRLGDSKARRAAMMRSAEGFEIDVTVRYPRWFEDELAELGPHA